MMLGSERHHQSRNALLTVASVSGVLIGLFLFLGAHGHFSAVIPKIEVTQKRTFLLLLPGVVLVVAGAINIALCKALWAGRRWALHIGLLSNGLTVIYFSYLLHKGVPNHPIGMFLALLASYLIVLISIRMGLVWPAVADDGGTPQ
ncbi:MAG: hypothetical protein AAF004_06095 [Pseudomonadota bacterium]